MLKKTGLSFVLYDFRHSFATRLAQAGVDLGTIVAILRHSGLQTVQRYIHISGEHQRAAMLRYDSTMQEALKGRASSAIKWGDST
ncbi:MAG: tyrosine-type recombinase/integrase [Acidobacteria bacterium]|nr:tyrosine-type recombinase/integrase [Acidobacteriota bacterium]